MRTTFDPGLVAQVETKLCSEDPEHCWLFRVNVYLITETLFIFINNSLAYLCSLIYGQHVQLASTLKILNFACKRFTVTGTESFTHFSLQRARDYSRGSKRYLDTFHSNQGFMAFFFAYKQD